MLILDEPNTGVDVKSQQSFYALWHFISEVSLNSIYANKQNIRYDLKELFHSMNMIESKEKFTNKITVFWDKYRDS